jgi:putative transposase
MQEIQGEINTLVDGIPDNPIVDKADIKQFLSQGISQILNRANEVERGIYLSNHPEDSGNGFLPTRTIKSGTMNILTSTPRTRTGNFYPSLLTKYERTVPEDYDFILRNLLINAKNFASVKRTLHSLNLPYRPDQLDELIQEIHDESKIFYTRRLDPDWYFIYIDAKCIDLMNENRKLDKAVVFTVVGINKDCKKEILSIQLFWGNESIDLWKKVLIDLKNRGVTRAMMLITDDFSGLTPIMKSLFPESDHQLCHIHLMRNAIRHLTKDEYDLFKEKLDDICMVADFESARILFLDLICKRSRNPILA